MNSSLAPAGKVNVAELPVALVVLPVTVVHTIGAVRLGVLSR